MIEASEQLKAPRTHCRRGHELVGDNVYVRRGDDFRVCRACERLRVDARRGSVTALADLQVETVERRRLRIAHAESHRLRRDYGVTFERFEQLAAAQSGKCAVCSAAFVDVDGSKLRSICIDRCATSGLIRGLLCRRCGNALARLGEFAARAASYVIDAHARGEGALP